MWASPSSRIWSLYTAPGRAGTREANLLGIQELERVIPVLPLDASTGEHYGRIRTELESKGSPIGAYDLLIAAHALALGLTLVSNNVREFRRIPQLVLENWVEELC